MTKTLTTDAEAKLLQVGNALDIDMPLAVGFGGEVFINTERERKNDAQREREGAASGQGPQRWSRQSQGTRQAGPGNSARLRSQSLPQHYLLGADEVRDRYAATFINGGNGLWVVAKSNPLGDRGPQFHLAAWLSANYAQPPMAWAFRKLGKFPVPVGPRHTNFPHHDICFQGAEDRAWFPELGVRPLLNLYSTWLLRHLYLEHFDRWPGRQWGMTAFYRRSEFHAEEWCGCGSNLRYGDCCMPFDMSLPEDNARYSHKMLTGGEYRKRVVPKAIRDFARSNWKKVPKIT